VVTRIAVHTQESVRQDAALEVGPDLALHETSDGSADRSRVFEEWLQVLTHNVVKECLFWLVAFVRNRNVVAGTGLVLKPLRNRRAGSRGERKHLTPCPVPYPSFEVGRSRPLVHGAFVNGGLIGCRSIGAWEDRADSNWHSLLGLTAAPPHVGNVLRSLNSLMFTGFYVRRGA
jgi:hypothetical protein